MHASYFLEVAREIESTSSRSVSPKNLKVLLDPLELFDGMFFMLVDFVRETVALRSIVESFDGSLKATDCLNAHSIKTNLYSLESSS